MAEVKTSRTKKKQLGQFMTPIEKCNEILNDYIFQLDDKILEPSFGSGNFILTLIDKFLPLYSGTIQDKLDLILKFNIFGCEYDPIQYDLCINNIKNKYGYFPLDNNLYLGDYFTYNTDIKFDYIIGNPPFGGTIDPKLQNSLDKLYGKRNNMKIKKETYSFFMIKSLESLKEKGELIFILSDTFLTIKTMKGLRYYLCDTGYNIINKLDYFSDETNYPMIIIKHYKSLNKNYITLDNVKISYKNMKITDNFSWSIQNEYIKYFNNELLSDYVIGSGGMTTGKNEYFLRDINDNKIIEEYDFNFFEDPITLKNEISRAKNNILSDKRKYEISELEKNGVNRRNVSITKKNNEIIELPNDNYRYYNKATNEILYSKPTTVIYWKDDGDACYTYKKNGNWYLGGVGGKSFFGKEGITWQLISSRIKARYLPNGYIIDNGSPIIILKDCVNKDELFFILGWLLTDLCNDILKKVINHTKNIQSKDIEKLPYPNWVKKETKLEIVKIVKKLILDKKNGLEVNISILNTLYKKES
ncbi:MAG: N-6 DNA methylase [Candidatus Muirbacterium halophilum]|nr:N-6 DNA methylase [Candidatus Muirbacterium halophilum]